MADWLDSLSDAEVRRRLEQRGLNDDYVDRLLDQRDDPDVRVIIREYLRR